MDNTISVIIPVYNPGPHLEKCLESILNQTYRNLEIVLVDDGSTDGSSDVCDEYAKKDRRILVIHQINSGVSRARNVGINVSKGDYLHFPDSDDYLELDTYERLLTLLRDNDCEAVAFEHYVTFPDREIKHQMNDDFYGRMKGVAIQQRLMKGSQFCFNKLFKRELIRDIRFPEDIYRGEDTVFAAYALHNAKSVYFSNLAFYHYVQSEESACRGAFRPSQFSALKLYEAYRPLYCGTLEIVYSSLCLFLQDVLISLYYDSWADKNAQLHKKERALIVKAIKEHKRIANSDPDISMKQKIKRLLFLISPSMFCRFHKMIHKL